MKVIWLNLNETEGFYNNLTLNEIEGEFEELETSVNGSIRLEDKLVESIVQQALQSTPQKEDSESNEFKEEESNGIKVGVKVLNECGRVQNEKKPLKITQEIEESNEEEKTRVRRFKTPSPVFSFNKTSPVSSTSSSSSSSSWSSNISSQAPSPRIELLNNVVNVNPKLAASDQLIKSQKALASAARSQIETVSKIDF